MLQALMPARVIERKRDGCALDPSDLESFLAGYLSGDVPDYQMAAFLMAVQFNGLDAAETDVLVRTMVASGETLDLSYLGAPTVDKHSTGGVGDKVSLALAPLAAAMGLYVPMMSGRGLGHTTGTLDKLEAIPGFRIDLGLDEFRAVLEKVGVAMIGQTSEIVPLDRRLYALRDVTATVPSIPLIAASIMSKKLAEGLSGLLLDVKVGAGAFIADPVRAEELARTMVGIGADRSLPTVALLTAMDRPLGRAIGNGLETSEAIRCLRGEGPDDLRELVLAEAVEMARLAEPGADGLKERATTALDEGRALERFVSLVRAQGGDPRIVDEPASLRTAPVKREVRALGGGIVGAIHPRPLGDGVVRLGGGRRRIEDRIDPGVGFELHVGVGDEVGPGDMLGVVHARSADDGAAGEEILTRAILVLPSGEPMPGRLPLVIGRIA